MKANKFLAIVLRVFAFLIALSLIVVSLTNYRTTMQEHEYELQLETAQQIARYDGAIVQAKLEGYLDAMTCAADFLKTRDLRDPQNGAFLHTLEEQLGLQSVGLTDTNGILRTSAGSQMDISDRPYFKKGMEGRDNVISNVAESKVSGNRVFAIGVPIRDGETIKGFLHGYMTLDHFQELSDERFHSATQGILVIDRMGVVILRGGEIKSPFSKYDNVLNLLDIIKSEPSAAQIQAAINRSEDLLVKAKNGSDDFVLYFSPLEMNGWYVISLLEEREIAQRVESVFGDTVFQLVLKVALAVVLLAVIIVLYLRKERKNFQQNEIKLRSELMAGTEGYMVVDLQRDTVVRYSAGITGKYNVGEMSYSELIKHLVTERVEAKYRDAAYESLRMKGMLAEHRKGIRDIRTEYPIVKDGKEVWRECSIHLGHDQENKHLMAYIIFKNVDAKKRHEIMLTERADNDYLTGLRNRRSAIEQIDQFLSTIRKDTVHTHAFLILDLDHFKSLNDTLGHQVGDQALKDVANVLSHHFREYDVISRLGGDEFVVFMKDMPREIIVTNVEALLKKMHLSYTADGQTVSMTASVGVAFAPMHGTNFETLYHKADRALYFAKENGKDRLHIYTSEDE